MAGEPPSKGSTVIGVNIAFAVAAFLFTVARFLTRILIVRDFGPEDWTIGIATLFTIAMTTCMGEQVHYGLGRHFDTLTPDEVQNMLKPFWASIWLYYMTLTFTKISILFQYYRIFIYERTRLAIWVMMGVVIAYGIATFFDSVFLCTPVSAFWNPSERRAEHACIDENTVWYSNAVVNIILDVAVVVLPMPAVRGLNISFARKVAVMALFALGGFVTITSVIRLYSLHQVAGSTDVTWDNVGAAVWSCIEANTGIMCACLPATRPLISFLRGRRSPLSSSHYMIPEDAHEMPLSPSNIYTPRSRHSARDSALPHRFNETPQLSPCDGKSTFLVSASRSNP